MSRLDRRWDAIAHAVMAMALDELDTYLTKVTVKDKEGKTLTKLYKIVAMNRDAVKGEAKSMAEKEGLKLVAVNNIQVAGRTW